MTDLHEWAERASRAWLLMVLGAVLVALLTGCRGIKIPPELLDCRTLGCPVGGVCTGPADGSGAFVCEPDTPAPTPTPTPTPEPTAEPTASPTAEPTPGPTPACTLGTPYYQDAVAPSWGISPYGRGFHFTAKARFGKAYYCTPEMNWPEACAAGRTEGPVAPEGHPQRIACERQFTGSTACPLARMKRCTGTGAQCPITFDAWIYDAAQDKEVPHPINQGAGCADAEMLPQNGTQVRGQWLQPSGKGTFEVCFDDQVTCTESKEIDQ